MSERLHPDDPQLAALCRIEQLLREQHAPAPEPAHLRTLTFSGEGEHPLLTHRDEHGPMALSIGIVNPTAVRIYLGLSGEKAQPGNHAFVVPKEAAMVIPVAVGKLEIGADPTDLGANSATIFRLRFETVQPFFLGAL